jgi:peptidoglycan hydrolase-like protein with peptidoglycan-binding domain
VYLRRRVGAAVGASVLVAAVGLVTGVIPTGASGEAGGVPPASIAAAPTTTLAPTSGGGDLDGGEFTIGEGCTLTVKKLTLNDSGADVACLQRALSARGMYSGPLDGTFDDDVLTAVSDLQTAEELFVDGVVGTETAGLLGIRKPLELRVVRTEPAPPKTMDPLGYYLSSVASTGSGAPDLPAGSGSGRRVVYDRLGQRVWAIDDDERILRSWLVSGSKFDNEVPGTFEVYSRSEETTAWNGKARLPRMIRYYQTDIGHIGFHGIPVEIESGKRYQTEAELGTPLSGGCQRQADLDAAFLWAFADVGMKVVVI